MGIGIIVIIIAVIIINVIYTFIRISELKGFNHTVKSLDKNHLLYFRDNFISISNDNFNYECDREKFVSLFLVTGLIFLYFVKGNPIINNYYGIYEVIETSGVSRSNPGGDSEYSDEPYIIIPSSNKKLVKNFMHEISKIKNEDKQIEFGKRGYIFIQAGFIDGFEPIYYDGDYKGFISYLSSIFYYLFEKFILTIMYFLIPFIISIGIFYKYRRWFS